MAAVLKLWSQDPFMFLKVSWDPRELLWKWLISMDTYYIRKHRNYKNIHVKLNPLHSNTTM